MYIAMNRFKIVLGKEKAFEDVWKNRETHLENVPGFKKFNLVKGEKIGSYALCITQYLAFKRRFCKLD